MAFAHANPTKQLRTTRPFPFTPDNVHMGEDGRLLTAGMKNDVPECGGAPGPQHSLEKLSTCPRGFMALAIDPKTMKDTLLAESPAIAAFSNATMVLAFDQQFWIGTFSGDRIAHGRLALTNVQELTPAVTLQAVAADLPIWRHAHAVSRSNETLLAHAGEPLISRTFMHLDGTWGTRYFRATYL